MGTTTPPWNIQERSLALAVRTIRLCDALHETRRFAAKDVGHQLLRSTSSIGANLHEAECAESKSDFVHKISIAHKEANETLYWLRLLSRSALLLPERLEAITQETSEIVAILTTIRKNARRNLRREPRRGRR